MTAATQDAGAHRQGLDVLRGIAAFVVVLGHARTFVLGAFGLDIRGDSSATRVLLLPTFFGKEAVAVFFVLSGYLVGGAVLRDSRRDTFTWPVYLTKRLSRLWTVLLPGLLLTAILGWVSRNWHPATYSLDPSKGSSRLEVAACNAAFLMPTRCVEYGQNIALWSLSYEFWFYITFAAVCVAFYALKSGRYARAAIAIAVAAAGVAIFGIVLISLFPAWLIGVCVAIAERRWPGRAQLGARRPWGWAASSATLLAALLASNLLAPPQAVNFLLVSIAAVPLVWLSLGPPTREGNRNIVAIGRWLGKISYSTYVYHVPVLVFLIGFIASAEIEGVGPLLPLVYLAAVVSIFITYPLYLLTEKNTGRIRNSGLRLLGATSRGSAGVNRRGPRRQLDGLK